MQNSVIFAIAFGIFSLRINKSAEFCNKGYYMIRRDYFLQLLIKSKDNGFPKAITGIKRCGKSFLRKEEVGRLLPASDESKIRIPIYIAVCPGLRRLEGYGLYRDSPLLIRMSRR